MIIRDLVQTTMYQYNNRRPTPDDVIELIKNSYYKERYGTIVSLPISFIQERYPEYSGCISIGEFVYKMILEMEEGV